jgi:DegV family protein with EDD domain
MRIVTNPGSNLDEDLTLRLDVDLLPSKIVVDGIPHDTRGTIDFAQVDGWVKRASAHPQVQGTTEQEFFDAFTRLAKKDAELLVIMSSRKLISSYDAAVAAAKRLREVRVEVVDSLTSDVGAGLMTLAAVQARAAGMDLRKTAQVVRTLCERGRNALSVATLDNLIKGGRASSLQGFVANFFNIRPLISIVDGAVTSVAKVSAKADPAEKIEEYLRDRLDPKRPMWLAVSHGNALEKAQRVVAKLQERFTCEYVLVRPFSPSIYLHIGAGGVAAFAYPVDGLELTAPGR